MQIGGGGIEQHAPLVPLPRLADGLATGDCTLAILRLHRRADGSAPTATSLGLRLLAAELVDRAARLAAAPNVGGHGDPAVAIIAESLAVSARALGRVLGHDRAAAVRLLSRRPAGGSIDGLTASTPGKEVYRAARIALQTLATAPVALAPGVLAPPTAQALASAGGDLFSVLAAFAAALPHAVAADLLEPAAGASSGPVAVAPVCWGLAAAAGVHAGLEAPAATHPASTAFVRCLAVAVARLPLSTELAALVRAALIEVGIGHATWRWRRAADRVDLAIALVELLAAVLQPPGPLCTPSHDSGVADAAARGELLRSLLHDGVLPAFLRVRIRTRLVRPMCVHIHMTIVAVIASLCWQAATSPRKRQFGS